MSSISVFSKSEIIAINQLADAIVNKEEAQTVFIRAKQSDDEKVIESASDKFLLASKAYLTVVGKIAGQLNQDGVTGDAFIGRMKLIQQTAEKGAHEDRLDRNVEHAVQALSFHIPRSSQDFADIKPDPRTKPRSVS